MPPEAVNCWDGVVVESSARSASNHSKLARTVPEEEEEAKVSEEATYSPAATGRNSVAA